MSHSHCVDVVRPVLGDSRAGCRVQGRIKAGEERMMRVREPNEWQAWSALSTGMAQAELCYGKPAAGAQGGTVAGVRRGPVCAHAFILSFFPRH